MLHAPFTPMCIVAKLQDAWLCCSYSDASGSPAYCILHTTPCVCKSPYHVSPITPVASGEVFTPQLGLSKDALLGVLRLDHLMQACDEEKLLGHLGVVLYEYLGEEYPEVLGSILGALKAIVNVIGMTKMTPPIKDLLPRLTPILKNRHEKVRMLGGSQLQLQQLCCCTVAYCPALPTVIVQPAVGIAVCHWISVLWVSLSVLKNVAVLHAQT